MTETKTELTYEDGYNAALQEDALQHHPLTLAQMRQLVADLNPARVAERKGGGNTNLSYLEAWDVRATLIRIFGFGQWSADLAEPVKVLRIDDMPSSQPGGKGRFRALALATVRVTIHQTGATYTESAASSQVGADIGEVVDFAVKTAESDAFKRACINLGTQFGLSLYQDGSKQDVVKVVLAPGQNETLKALRAPKNPVPQGDKAPPAPGEDPRDDLPADEQPMVLQGMGHDALRAGFDRGQQ